LTFGAFTGGNAFDVGADTITINGAAGNETITATTFGDTINAGAGADTIKINAASLTDRSWTVDLGSDAVQDTVIFNHAALGLTNQTVVTVNNFAVANDRIAVTLNGTADTGLQTITADGTSFTGTNRIVEIAINNAARVTTDLIGDGNGGAIENIIQAATTNLPATGSYTFIIYSDLTATANAGIYTVNITDDTDPNQTGMTVEHVMTLNGVGFGALGASNFANLTIADPIILDLGVPGIAFASGQDAVAFDINGDGVSEHMAWTAGEDGILVLDIDGSGTIDNGTEIFSPDFAGGSFAGALAALATLDSNGDGLIDANDDAFASLQVWQDLDHDGVTDTGELASLTDHGISAINLNATPSDTEIDGQQLLSEGTFIFDDGTSGSFVEVALDPVPEAPVDQMLAGGADSDTLSGADGNDTLAGGQANDFLYGGLGSDSFVFDDAGAANADFLGDYAYQQGDTIVLNEALSASFGNDLARVRLEQSGDDLHLQIDTSGLGDWTDVATLDGYGTDDPVSIQFVGADSTLIHQDLMA